MNIGTLIWGLNNYFEENDIDIKKEKEAVRQIISLMKQNENK
ncbi:hypothetical protein ACOTWR_06050 [Aliarcobacter butzleri]